MENFMLRADDITLSSCIVRLFGGEYSSILVHSKKERKFRLLSTTIFVPLLIGKYNRGLSKQE